MGGAGGARVDPRPAALCLLLLAAMCRSRAAASKATARSAELAAPGGLGGPGAAGDFAGGAGGAGGIGGSGSGAGIYINGGSVTLDFPAININVAIGGSGGVAARAARAESVESVATAVSVALAESAAAANCSSRVGRFHGSTQSTLAIVPTAAAGEEVAMAATESQGAARA